MYEIIHGSVFYSDSFYGEVDFVERSFSKTFLKRFTFDFIITGNGYIEARELDPFLQELFDARYHVSIGTFQKKIRPPLWRGRFRHPSFLLSEPLKFASEGFKILSAPLKKYSESPCVRVYPPQGEIGFFLECPIYYFLYRWQACGFEYSRQKCRNYGADISVTMVVIRGKLII